MYAHRIPDTIISWLKLTTPPRIFGGVCSAMYIGDTNDAQPTESPRTNRAAISSGTFWENAEARAAITYTAPDSAFVHRRLIRSAR